jgi:hypothetical protein
MGSQLLERGSEVAAWFRLQQLVLLAGALALPRGVEARTPPRCKVICPPTLSLAPGTIISHLLGHPEVRSLSDGSVQRLPSNTNFEIILDLGVPTAVPRLSLFSTVQWLPTAEAPANPFTEYTASQLGTSDVRANIPSVTLGARYAALKSSQTGGWVSLTPYVGDLFSRAGRPDSKSDYTHKLDLGLIAAVAPFSRLSPESYIHNLKLYATLDWVATGLPHAGDELPGGERVFLTGANATSLILGLSAPLAPPEPAE